MIKLIVLLFTDLMVVEPKPLIFTDKNKQKMAVDIIYRHFRTKFDIVPGAGVEPARYCYHWCLRPARLPIPPSGLSTEIRNLRQVAKVPICFKFCE